MILCYKFTNSSDFSVFLVLKNYIIIYQRSLLIYNWQLQFCVLIFINNFYCGEIFPLSFSYLEKYDFDTNKDFLCEKMALIRQISKN
jgi:hypothetical protein